MDKIIFNCVMIFVISAIMIAEINIINCQEFDGDLNSVLDNEKLKRESTSGLFPFPRVGRGLWRTNFLGNRKMLEQMKRREGLIPFPRVGRAEHTVVKSSRLNEIWIGKKIGNPSNDPSMGEVWLLFPIADYDPSAYKSKSNQKQEMSAFSTLEDEIKNHEKSIDAGEK